MDAILYRARRVSHIVQREVDRLVRELPDFRTFIVCYDPDYESVLHSVPGTVYCYGQKDLHALPYPQKLSAVDWSNPKSRPAGAADSKQFFRAMEWGHQDLPVLKFYLEHPDFDCYWVIEDDVRCSGPWAEILLELTRSSADLLMTVVQNYEEAPGWYWWKYLQTGNETVPLECRVKAFPPFCRLSKACLQSIDEKYRQGWGGHYEVTWPTIARASGLLIEDVGGLGSFTPSERRARFYTSTYRNAILFPGTFVYRPAFLDTGVSEFGKNVMPQVMLWHPVKTHDRPAADPLATSGASIVNLALGKPALQSSVTKLYSLRQTPAEDAKGGNNGNLSCQYGFHTAQEPEPWWQVDLKDLFLVHRVVIFNRSDEAQRLRHFSLLGSRDGDQWHVLFRKLDYEVFGQNGEPYPVELEHKPLLRFMRVRLDGTLPLHFRECQVFGEHPDPKIQAELERRNYVPPGRQGRVLEVGGLAIFADQNYDTRIVEALERGDYEGIERELVAQLLTKGDRVIDVGTAIGAVAMTQASIVGAENVVTFDANPEIVSDARANFKRNGLEGIQSHVGLLQNRKAIKDPHETKTFHIDKAFWASRLDVSIADKNIVKAVQVPILCLEDVIKKHRATVLVCDMEGAEVELFRGADLAGIRLIIMETHYWIAGEVATDEMIHHLIKDGFLLHLGLSGFFRAPDRRRVLVLRRPSARKERKHKPITDADSPRDLVI